MCFSDSGCVRTLRHRVNVFNSVADLRFLLAQSVCVGMSQPMAAAHSIITVKQYEYYDVSG